MKQLILINILKYRRDYSIYTVLKDNRCDGEGGASMEVFNCPNCNSLFVMTKFRDVRDACYKEEEAQYDKVYAYSRKKINRTASMMQVVKETGV